MIKNEIYAYYKNLCGNKVYHCTGIERGNVAEYNIYGFKI